MTNADEVVDRAATDARDDRGHRVLWIFVWVTLGGLVLLASALIATRVTASTKDGEQDSKIAAAEKRADDNAAAAAQLADQVRALGAQPVVLPPVPGDDGTNGRDGVDGRDGRDGVSPPCLSEPAQCRGADGADGRDGVDGQDGADGVDGRDGVDGEDGQPPASFTLTDPAGREHTCTRNPESPDSAPTYTCTAPSPRPPTTSEPGVLPTIVRRR